MCRTSDLGTSLSHPQWRVTCIVLVGAAMGRLAILLFFLSFSLLGDRIVLKNGKEYSGTFIHADEGKVRFRIGKSTVRTFRSADIAQLEIGAKTPKMRRRTPVQDTDRHMPARTPAQVVEAEPAPAQNPSPTPFLTAPEIGTAAASPVAGAVAIDSEYTRMGAETGALGAARAPHQPTADRRASMRIYASGIIYWTKDGGAHAILGPILQAWTAQGGENSRLGYPNGDEKVSNGGFAREQEFLGGRITWTERDGARVVYSGL